MSPFVPPGSDCANVSDCFPCNKLPGTNTSAEGQDVLQDFVIQWGNLQTNTPPLGSLFQANGCTIVCVSSISQEEAFLCAQRTQALCVIDKWQPPPFEPPICLNFPCTPTAPPVVPPAAPFTNEPEACSTRCPDGVPFTFAVAGGSFVSASQAMANRIAASFACREATLHQLCLSLISPFVCLDQSSTLTFIASGRFVSPTSNLWELRSGNLPPGITFTNATTGPVLSITGVAIALGDYTFSIRVTAPSGDFAERSYTVTVAGITTADPLPDAQLGTDYSETLTSAAFTGDLVWLIVDGVLPEGLELDEETGEISGQATEDGDFTFTVSVSNDTHGCEKEFTLTVAGCFIDSSSNSSLSQGQTFTLARNGSIADIFDGSSGDGWYYLNHIFQSNGLSLGNLPDINCVAGGDSFISGLDGSNNVYWIDIATSTIRNIGAFGALPQSMNDNGDFVVSDFGSLSYIYNAGANSLSANLFTADVFSALDLNNSRVAIGTIPVAGLDHLFIRSAGGVYTDLHPAAGGTSGPLPGSGGGYKAINSADHVCGVRVSGGISRVFANFGGASIFLSGNLPAGTLGGVFINENDEVAWIDATAGHLFIYNGVTVDHGFANAASLEGFTDDGVAVGTGPVNAWIFDGTSFSTLISKIPSAAGDGWTLLNISLGINNQNFVAGYGTKSGNPNTIFVAKVCL